MKNWIKLASETLHKSNPAFLGDISSVAHSISNLYGISQSESKMRQKSNQTWERNATQTRSDFFLQYISSMMHSTSNLHNISKSANEMRKKIK